MRNNGGLVIAQVKRLAAAGTLRPHDVVVPGVLVDVIVVAPDQMQTTHTPYEPAISGEIFRPLSSFETPKFDVAKVIARRVAHGVARRRRRQHRLRHLRQRAAHPDRGRPARRGDLGDRTGRGRRRAAARLPVRLRLQRRGDRALAAAVHLFPGRRLRHVAAVVPADRPRRLGQRLQARRAAACDGRRGGFVDITARAKRIVFSGYFTAGAGLDIEDGALRIDKEGKVKKLVERRRAGHLLRAARGRAGPGHPLRHRALRDAADARGRHGHRDRARRRSRARRAGAEPSSRCASRAI